MMLNVASSRQSYLVQRHGIINFPRTTTSLSNEANRHPVSAPFSQPRDTLASDSDVSQYTAERRGVDAYASSGTSSSPP